MAKPWSHNLGQYPKGHDLSVSGYHSGGVDYDALPHVGLHRALLVHPDHTLF